MKSKTNLRILGRTHGKHGKVSTRSSRNKPQISKATTERKEGPSKVNKEEKYTLIEPDQETKLILKRRETRPNKIYPLIMAEIGTSSIVFNTGRMCTPLLPIVGKDK